MLYLATLLTCAIILGCLVLYHKVLKVPANMKHLPGPSIFSTFKNLYQQRDMCTVFTEHHAKYGKVFKKFTFRGNWMIVVCNPESAKAVLKDSETFGKISRRTPMLDQNLGDGVLICQGAQWKKQRKICNPAFSFNYLKSFTPIFANSAALAVNHAIHKHSNPTSEKVDIEFDVSQWMQLMTLDVLGKSIFGMDFGCLSTDNQSNQYADTYNKVMEGLFDPIRFLTGGMSDNVPTKRTLEYKQHLKAFNDVLYGVIDARKQERKQNAKTDRQPDLLDMMLDSMTPTDDADNGDGELELSTKELHNNMFVFFIAGHDTTSTALTMALHYLSRNIDAQTKAREELLAILGDKKTIEFDDQKQLKYLTQVIKESMRMYSPVIQVAREATKNTTIPHPSGDNDTIQVNKGDAIAVGIHAIHRSKYVWGDNASTFNADNFASDKRNHPYAWIPFGAGKRSCIGSNFSLIEQRIFLATILLQYDLLPPTQPNHQHFNVKSPVILSVDNVFVRFVERT